MARSNHHYSHMRLFPKFSRAQYHAIGTPMWRRLKAVKGDKLAFRELMLLTEGRETVINCILGDHNLPNKY